MTLKGIVKIRDGKVIGLQNVTDSNRAILDHANPLAVLNNLAQAGWMLSGDQDLEISRPKTDQD